VTLRRLSGKEEDQQARIMGWLTRKLLKEGGYGPIVDFVTCIAGAVVGGSIIRVASSPNQGGLAYTSFAAIVGAAIVTGINADASARKRYAITSTSCQR
jgi:uncharacterized membrane protein YeaQ/YmgE (transglycosylase-associated protein family)